MAKHNETGILGEDLAAKYLSGNGYQIRHTGWRWQRLEIDIVAEDDNVMAFVEVKTRKNADYGSPLLAVDDKKRKHLFDAAEAYIESYEVDKAVRFDIVVITLEPFTLDHVLEAFSPEFE